MAVDQFLKLTDLDGESPDDVHSGEIEVLSWSWGMSQGGSMHSGKGGGSGKASVQDMTITKPIDKASPNLEKACCAGTQYEEAVLTVRKAGDSPLEYLIITMTDVIITNISMGGAQNDEQLLETVTLNFASFTTSYTPQKADGTGDAAIDSGWDIAKNVEK